MQQRQLWFGLLGSFVFFLATASCSQAQNRSSIKQLQEQMQLLVERVAVLEATNAEYKAKLQAMESLFTCVKYDKNALIFEGCNVHIRNGSGSTDSLPNGLGNLIIGYNEDQAQQAMRGGSHNLVIGMEHSYSSVAGLVAGYQNVLAAPHSSISGGTGNTVRGEAASICGGLNNTATGDTASIAGGFKNTASGARAHVSGGFGNEASGSAASVSGGLNRTATQEFSWRAGDLQQGQ